MVAKSGYFANRVEQQMEASLVLLSMTLKTRVVGRLSLPLPRLRVKPLKFLSEFE